MTARALVRPILQAALLCALITAVAAGAYDIYKLTLIQAPGADFSCVWAGALSALHDPSRIYDFAHNSAQQGWLRRRATSRHAHSRESRPCSNPLHAL